MKTTFYKTHFFLFALLVLGSARGSAQSGKQIIHQNLYWLAYFNTVEFNKHWFVTTELQERRFLNPDKQHQFLVRSHIHYRLGHGWDISAGFTYFLQSPHDPHSATTLVVPELRPHIEFNYRQAANRVIISHRYRAEWRFFHNTTSDELVDGYWNYFRFRYRIGLDFILLKDKDERGGLKLKLSDEVHINAGSNIVRNSFDQNRIYAGIYYQALKSLGIEIGYMNWFQQRSSGNQYYERDIVRLMIHHKINLSKKE